MADDNKNYKRLKGKIEKSNRISDAMQVINEEGWKIGIVYTSEYDSTWRNLRCSFVKECRDGLILEGTKPGYETYFVFVKEKSNFLFYSNKIWYPEEKPKKKLNQAFHNKLDDLLKKSNRISDCLETLTLEEISFELMLPDEEHKGSWDNYSYFSECPDGIILKNNYTGDPKDEIRKCSCTYAFVKNNINVWFKSKMRYDIQMPVNEEPRVVHIDYI